MDRKKFSVCIAGEKLDFTFYTMNYILNDLKKTFKDETIIKVYDLNKYIKWSPIRQDNENNVYYFSYIKFFKEEDIEYGIIGGKTNYNNPDISFDGIKKEDSRYGRIFLEENDYKYSNNVIVIHHKKVDDKADNFLAKFIECYIQRKYNLFDS